MQFAKFFSVIALAATASAAALPTDPALDAAIAEVKSYLPTSVIPNATPEQILTAAQGYLEALQATGTNMTAAAVQQVSSLAARGDKSSKATKAHDGTCCSNACSCLKAVSSKGVCCI